MAGRVYGGLPCIISLLVTSTVLTYIQKLFLGEEGGFFTVSDYSQST